LGEAKILARMFFLIHKNNGEISRKILKSIPNQGLGFIDKGDILELV